MEDEYTIIEEPKRRPSNFPDGFIFSFETSVNESKGEYDLESYDRRTVDSLVRFVDNGYEPYFSPETFEKIVRRGQANNHADLQPLPMISKCLEEDVVSGVIMLSRQLQIAVSGCYGCDPHDSVDSMCALMAAVGDGVIARKEYEAIRDMLEFRRIASFRLDVEPPSAEKADEWFRIAMKVISRCYGTGAGSKP